MWHIRAIQYKALMLLVVFAANFFVVCHCQASGKMPVLQEYRNGLLPVAAGSPECGTHSCCESHSGKEALAVGGEMDLVTKAVGCGASAADAQQPCKGGDGCQHTQAVKFQLLEKQVADPVNQPPVLVTFVIHHFVIDTRGGLFTAGNEKFWINRWPGAYSPPDYQALYQSFLI